jgi:Tol biopolymer transport system component
MMRAPRALVLLIASALGTAGAASASPSANGPIVFQSTRAGGAPELFLQNEAATDVRRLTFNAATDRMPRFSSDGEWIAFSSDRDGNLEIYVMR